MARARYYNNAFTVDGVQVQIVPYATVTLYDATTSNPLLDTIYDSLAGAGTLPNPFTTDQYGNIEFYLASPKRVKVVVTGVGMGTITLDNEPVHPDPADYITNPMTVPLLLPQGAVGAPAIRWSGEAGNDTGIWFATGEVWISSNAGAASVVAGVGGLTVYGAASLQGAVNVDLGLFTAFDGIQALSDSNAVYGATIQNTHATGPKTARFLDRLGGIVLDVSGTAQEVGIGIGAAANPAANATTGNNRVLITDSHSYATRQTFDIRSFANASGESAAFRSLMYQNSSGDATIYGAEIKTFRMVGTAGAFGIQTGWQGSVAPSTPAHAIGISIVNHGTTWGIVSPVRGGTALDMGADDQGWDYGIRYRGTGGEGIPELFHVSGQAGTNRQAGDVMARGRLYSTQGGVSGLKVGPGVAHQSPASGEILAGMFYDTSQKALQVGAASFADSYRPLLLNPYLGAVAIGEDVVADIPSLVSFYVNGIVSWAGAAWGKKIATPSAPPSGYSGLYPKSNEIWFRQTSGGVEVPEIDSTMGLKNRIRNGDMRVQQRLVLGSTDNSMTLDGWRLLMEAANAAVVTQETADAPSNGGNRAIKLTVGSANNNKFGIFQVLSFLDCSDLKNKSVSLQFKMKATAGITDVRAAVVEWTSTPDGTTGDPISAWGAAGTNPTLATNWAYCSGYTPVSLAPTTSWATYKIEGVTVGGGTNNIAVLIWVDDKTTTTTTDILRVTDVQLEEGAVCTAVERRSVTLDTMICQRYYYEIAPGSTLKIMSTSAQAYNTTSASCAFQLPVMMRAVPTFSYNALGDFVLTNAGFTATGPPGDIAYSSYNPANRVAQVNFNNTTGVALTAGQATHVFSSVASGASARLMFNAEI